MRSAHTLCNAPRVMSHANRIEALTMRSNDNPKATIMLTRAELERVFGGVATTPKVVRGLMTLNQFMDGAVQAHPPGWKPLPVKEVRSWSEPPASPFWPPPGRGL